MTLKQQIRMIIISISCTVFWQSGQPTLNVKMPSTLYGCRNVRHAWKGEQFQRRSVMQQRQRLSKQRHMQLGSGKKRLHVGLWKEYHSLSMKICQALQIEAEVGRAWLFTMCHDLCECVFINNVQAHFRGRIPKLSSSPLKSGLLHHAFFCFLWLSTASILSKSVGWLSCQIEWSQSGVMSDLFLTHSNVRGSLRSKPKSVE